MVLAASHVIGALGVALLISNYLFVSKRGYLFAAAGALIPDFDFLPALIFSDMSWHRAYLNFWFIPFVIFGIGSLLFPKYQDEVLLFSIGYLVHLVLDLIEVSLLTLAMIDGLVITSIVTFLLFKYWHNPNKVKLNSTKVN